MPKLKPEDIIDTTHSSTTTAVIYNKPTAADDVESGLAF